MRTKADALTMKYYYNIDKKNNGPVTKEELESLAEKGIINEKTPVIEVGGKVWSRWGTISAPAKSAAPAAAPVKKPILSAASIQVGSPAMQAAPVAAAPSAGGASPFADMIHAVYAKIDHAMEPKNAAEAAAEGLDGMEKKFSSKAARVGIFTLVCFLTLGLANGMYKSLPALFFLVLYGCVVQYLSYQAYRAMTPLLFGKKIKLSSMGAVRMLAIMCIVPILDDVGGIINALSGDGDIKVKEFLVSTIPNIIDICLYAGICYGFFNAKRFFVVIEPQSVSPGRELVNLVRVILRAVFSALHTLAPALIILAAIMIAASGSPDTVYPESVGDCLSLVTKMVEHMYRFPTALVDINLAILPIYTLICCYVLSLVPDLLESILSLGDHKN